MKGKLKKSSKDRVFLGVCGGIAEYLDVDPTVVRIVWVICSLVFGSGVLVYLICAILMPSEER